MGSTLDIASALLTGAESPDAPQAHPIDLVHLARQTLGDRSIEAEVLALFMLQAASVREALDDASPAERARLAHGLRGSASGIGAFQVAEAAKAMERKPEDPMLLCRLAQCMDEARDFIASIGR